MTYFNIAMLIIVAAYAIFVIIYTVLMRKIKSNFSQDNNSITTDITKQVFYKIIEAYEKAEPSIAKNWLSSNYYESLKNEINQLNAKGIRRIIEIKPTPVEDGTAPSDEPSLTVATGFYMEEGKNKAVQMLASYYGDDYYVDSNGNRITKATYKNDHRSITFIFVKSVTHTDSEKENYICKNCGNPLQINGDKLSCPYCSTIYNVGDYDWSLAYDNTSVERNNTSKAKAMLPLIIIIPAFLLMFFGAWWMTFIPAIPICAYFTTIFMKSKKMKENISALVAKDSLFSLDGMSQRSDRLIKKVKYAKLNNNLLQVKPFCTEHMYNKLQDDKYDICGLLHDNITFSVNTIGMRQYFEGDGIQYVTVEVKLSVFNFNTGKESKQKITATFARKDGVQTNSYCGVINVECPNCMASIDVGEKAKCDYCGTTIDMINYDWVLHDIF